MKAYGPTGTSRVYSDGCWRRDQLCSSLWLSVFISGMWTRYGLVSGKAVEQSGAAGAYQTFLAAASGRMSGVP